MYHPQQHRKTPITILYYYYYYPIKIKRIPWLALVRTVAELIALVKHFYSISGSWRMSLNHLVDSLRPTVEGQLHQFGDSDQSGEKYWEDVGD